MFRIVIDTPVEGVAHSLQDKEGGPLDPRIARAGEPLILDVPVHVAPGPKFSGNQVRREGPERRFIYARIGDLAGDPQSPGSRRMKINVHDTPALPLERALRGEGVIEYRIPGTAKDGTPA